MTSKPKITCLLKGIALWAMVLPLGSQVFGQNDNCSSSETISISNSGFGTGTFTSPTIDISGATVEAGESFAPAIASQGQTAKSIWFRFSLPTTRTVGISLAQSGSAIAAGDVGLTVYKTTACLPTNADISNQLPPLPSFGSTSYNCVKAGDYLVQVTGKSSANGQVYVQISVGPPAAAYDLTTAAYDFGTLGQGAQTIGYAVDCQSTEDATEACPSLNNYQQYNKSTWHVFKTPPAPSSIAFTLSYQFNTGLQKFGLALFQGDIRRSAVTQVGSCDSLLSDAPRSASLVFKCDVLKPDTVYSLQLFFDQNFTDNVQVSLGTAAPLIQNMPVTVCSGTSYTLPWGQVVTAAGIYRDTLRTSHGCDSIVYIADVQFSAPQTTQTFHDTICAGVAYTLPWGGLASAAGVYSDTIKSVGGCDSLIQVVNLAIKAVVIDSSSASFCQGNSYTLPWGTVVSSGGIYRDTMKAAGGCDSLVRIRQLSVDSAAIQSDTVSICAGGTYNLPWGVAVAAAGTYTDTVRHRIGGCDSLVRIVQVKTLSTTTQNSMVSFCAGSTYTLPWGVTVSSPGIYRDTLRSTTGCDSLIRVVDVSTNAVTIESFTARICPGETYTLPWGTIVSSPGIYSDTLQGKAGCDSVIKRVDLLVGTVLRDTADAGICKGQGYTLPSGTTVHAAGVYEDTLRSAGGCDSVIHVIRLFEKQAATVTTAAAICPGASYSLPWGGTVTSPGVYRDTARYSDGCDSLIQEVDLRLDTVRKLTSSASICPGQTYTLPWGAVVSLPGLYSDTSRSQGGCDSLIQVVQLTSPSLSTQTINAGICPGGHYTLPWGSDVSTAGTYSDTVKTAGGCDSLVQVVNLRESSPPLLSLSKSNDIDCMATTARLSASGGASYVWSPAASLDNPNSTDPLASPSTSTMYYVQATSPEGCVAVDSILVTVSPGGVENGYWVPNAFTPNNDGKNDCFGIKHWGAVSRLSFIIYNRWGEVVFQTRDVASCWDGTFKGALLPTGTFVYLIEAETICGPVKRKGTVTLIR